jgi:hypothetical protein
MKRSSGPRKAAILSDSVHQQLNMYAIAASAAGAGMLAFAQPAAAKIIYTPAHVRISGSMSYQLDLNHDGKPDFKIGVYSFSGSSHSIGDDMYVLNLRTFNAVVTTRSGFVQAFRPGVRIGPKQPFFGGSTTIIHMANCRTRQTSHFSSGPWLNVKNRYLGLRFSIKGKTHYGWARLTTDACAKSDILTGYAYETVPHKTIVTGKTTGPEKISITSHATTGSLVSAISEHATLGILALGAPALSIWKRDESASAISGSN